MSCPEGRGYRYEDGIVSHYLRHFKKHSVGLVKKRSDKIVVWLIGPNEEWSISKNEIYPIDVLSTGDKHDKKICNRCHCLLAVEDFARNQNNKHGIIRRPTCKVCEPTSTNVLQKVHRQGKWKNIGQSRERHFSVRFARSGRSLVLRQKS